MAAMVVPTDGGDVRAWLRKLGEPVTLFGERAMERRERLRLLMAQLPEERRAVLQVRSPRPEASGQRQAQCRNVSKVLETPT